MKQVDTDSAATITIGTISQETGIPVETLRTWERRYGYPEPERRPSGHRLYRASDILRLKLIAAAVSAGHRPSKVVGVPNEALMELLEGEDVEASVLQDLRDAQRDASDERPDVDGVVAAWLDAAHRLDGRSLDAGMRDTWKAVGTMDFVETYGAAFLREVGESWAAGKLDILHEHFASERFRDFLTAIWRPMSDEAHGPPVVLFTLPDEQHSLGLHLAATASAIAGCRVIFLGTDTPLAEVLSAARQTNPGAVMISVSQASDADSTRADLIALRRVLSPDTAIVVGGGGAPIDIAGVTALRSLESLRAFCEGLAAGRG